MTREPEQAWVERFRALDAQANNSVHPESSISATELVQKVWQLQRVRQRRSRRLVVAVAVGVILAAVTLMPKSLTSFTNPNALVAIDEGVLPTNESGASENLATTGDSSNGPLSNEPLSSEPLSSGDEAELAVVQWRTAKQLRALQAEIRKLQSLETQLDRMILREQQSRDLTTSDLAVGFFF